jgi:hypothetical protein
LDAGYRGFSRYADSPDHRQDDEAAPAEAGLAATIRELKRRYPQAC